MSPNAAKKAKSNRSWRSQYRSTSATKSSSSIPAFGKTEEALGASPASKALPSAASVAFAPTVFGDAFVAEMTPLPLRCATEMLLQQIPGMLFSGMVVLVAGDKEFHVHKALLCHFSKEFAKEEEQDVSGLSKGRVNLQDVQPEVIAAFRNWLYTRQFYNTPKDKQTAPMALKTLVDIYIFGATKKIPSLEDSAISAMIDICRNTNTFPDLDLAVHAYENTSSGSLIRKLFVDLTLEARPRITFPMMFRAGQDASKAAPFLLDVVVKFGINYKARIDKCRYHIHPE
ncbi:MAG: hypothetical protein M1820_005693 [Bogoriella megaspora]|nr:MAG: hypothetical protein M1820_005693 [Bogoriella megaspora]